MVPPATLVVVTGVAPGAVLSTVAEKLWVAVLGGEAASAEVSDHATLPAAGSGRPS